MRKGRKTYDAYFTVEATLIIPVTFLLIMAMIQYGFFCYEKSVSLQCCYLAALRGSNEWDLTGNNLKKYVEDEFKELLHERNLYPSEGNKEIKISFSGVEVSYNSYMNTIFSAISEGNVNGWYIQNTKNAVRNIPSTYIRKYQMIKSSGGEHDGSNQQE